MVVQKARSPSIETKNLKVKFMILNIFRQEIFTVVCGLMVSKVILGYD